MSPNTEAEEQMRLLSISLVCLALFVGAPVACAGDATGGAAAEHPGDATGGAAEVRPVNQQIEDWEARPDYEHTANPLQYIPRGTFERYAVVLALLTSAVALGLQRKQPWALVFARELGRSRVRVRGYLVPVNKPGVITPRPVIGLENPGLPTMKIGSGTAHMSYARETVLEFQGTNDGSPPTLVVERGQVRVDGEVVTRWQLRSGDVIEAEGLRFKYMKGHRR